MKLALTPSYIPEMQDTAVAKVYQFETLNLERPQVPIITHHNLHGGMYARTIMIPANIVLTGALIKIPTILIVSGHAIVYTGNESRELIGYHVLSASKNRKQVYLTKTDTHVTMVFPTEAESVLQAEEEFTDEGHLLMSRKEEGE